MQSQNTVLNCGPIELCTGFNTLYSMGDGFLDATFRNLILNEYYPSGLHFKSNWIDSIEVYWFSSLCCLSLCWMYVTLHLCIMVCWNLKIKCNVF